jgi:hypothetical protein
VAIGLAPMLHALEDDRKKALRASHERRGRELRRALEHHERNAEAYEQGRGAKRHHNKSLVFAPVQVSLHAEITRHPAVCSNWATAKIKLGH